MKLLPIYSWIAGSQNDFTRQFQENELLFDQARAFWNKLESSMTLVLGVTVLLGFLCAAYYYTLYNQKPGRRYTPKHWLIFLGVTFVLTLVVTLVIEFSMATPRLNGAKNLEIMVSIGNAIYSSFMYFITSVLWCYFGRTNACRIFKFSKR